MDSQSSDSVVAQRTIFELSGLRSSEVDLAISTSSVIQETEQVTHMTEDNFETYGRHGSTSFWSGAALVEEWMSNLLLTAFCMVSFICVFVFIFRINQFFLLK